MSLPKPANLTLPMLPQAPQAPPVFGAEPTKKKPQQKSMTPTVLGAEALPQQGQRGQKTLLGQ